MKNKNRLLNKLFNFFASVKLSIIILISLAATSIIGTVIPQSGLYEFYINNYGETITKIFYAFNLIDMYHSSWFITLELLLCINITVCSINRLIKDKQKFFSKHPKFNLSFFLKSENKKEIISDKPAAEILNVYRNAVSKSFSYSKTEKKNNGYVIFAEKGKKSALAGVYIVHTSIIILLTGALIGSIFGFDGFLNLAEGETASEIRLTERNEMKKLDFALKCNDFEVKFYENGSPKEYRTDLSVIENNKEVLKKSIIVNDPLRYKGINVFQSSYGMLDSKSVTLNFFNKDSGKNYLKKAKLNKHYQLPENKGEFIVKAFTSSYKFGGKNIGEVFLVSINLNTGEKYSAVIPVRFKRFDMMRDGAFIISAGSYDKHYYTGLQITKDPGVPYIYTGFIMIIIGCFMIFFLPHKKICIYIKTKADKSYILIAGSSQKDKAGIITIINRLASII
ncbi:MAG: cytochrome c biogenesis protein ResB [Deltaproteobacteria bacterium]|nr:cytochrome c biogenesis protein ResB [Deltaproteobacteria bacterium]